MKANTISQRFEQDFRQALLEDDPGEYELPVAADGIAGLSEKDIERIVRIAAASFENVHESQAERDGDREWEVAQKRYST